MSERQVMELFDSTPAYDAAAANWDLAPVERLKAVQESQQ
jgi:hypothetical protein